MTTHVETDIQDHVASIPLRLWIYTNFDCNLSCKYCLSSSSPSARRREIALDQYEALVDDAAGEGIRDVFLTGGEPFLLPDIFERISHALSRSSVTILTNALLLRHERIDRLVGLRDDRLTLQVSLDGHIAELHDAYRGQGTWHRTVERIQELVRLGFNVAIGATQTPVNMGYEAQLRTFVAGLGIPDERFFIRPLTLNGLSQEGLVLQPEAIVPELTVTVDGVFWHPQAGGAAHLLSRSYSPLRPALDLIRATYERVLAGGPRPQIYRCT